MKALIGILTSVAVGVTVAPRSLPEVDPLLGPSAQATAVATFALQAVAAFLCAYVALVLLALLLARLRLVPSTLRRAIDRWTGGGLAGSLRRLVGATTLTLGVLPLTPVAAAPIAHPTAPVIQPVDALSSGPTATPADSPHQTSGRPDDAPPVLRPVRQGDAGEAPAPTGPTTPAQRADRPEPPSPGPAHDPAAPILRSPAGDRHDETRPARPATGPERPDPRRRVTVESGESFWSIAEALVTLHLQRPPTDPEVIGPWLDLIAANRDALPDPGDPDLLLPGTVLHLPVRAGW